ncbi:hypothetical protein PANT_19d00149 [Moesziomyces antarcticus T-34]|uniref:Uncharacterized protein n=1 Tax=Pseudozyma antarctica (strain T-34) TaxID=1151754 RepID=M9LS26_PSEA3|nr:hypothetical protein PANT_19d00149 [Moesziomyces antarcticus T-34]
MQSRQLFTLLWFVFVATSIKAYLIDPAKVVWEAGMPIEEAVEALKMHVVEAMQSDSRLKAPHLDAFPQFFRDMNLINRMSGRRARYPITGLEWNAWYEGELRRIHADGQAYQRSVAETHAAAARLPRDGRLL